MAENAINPFTHGQALPRVVQAARKRQESYEGKNAEVAEPRISANLHGVELVAERLETLHARVADRTDLDLLGHTRPSALWLMSGRCLGLLRALLVQVKAGICGAAMPTARALHEADMLLQVLGDREEDELLERWLDDPDDPRSYVKHHEVVAAIKRFEDRLDAAAEEHGLGELGPRPSEYMRPIYDLLSRAGHNRRLWAVDEVTEETRRMSYGFHVSAIRRAAYADHTVEMAKEVTRCVGIALAALLGRELWNQQIEPLLASLKAVEQSAPLDPDSIRAVAGTA